MAALLLQIRWYHGTEFISIDPDAHIKSGAFVATNEYWPEEGVTVTYRAKCASYFVKGSVHSFSLQYIRSQNPRLKDKNEFWGRSDISINVRTRETGKAKWTDDNMKHMNGTTACRILDDTLIDDYSYEALALTRTRPKQNPLREKLLKMDGKCALSGERTRAVLDAVHIVEAHKKGGYSPANSFLLRTDYHRLFDRGLLRFDARGRPRLERGVSSEYQRQLKGKAIAPQVLLRVAKAMKRRFP